MNMTPKAEALKNLNFQTFQALMGIEKKHSFPSLEAFIQHLREFDLHDILDIHSRCNCFFHEDVRPSANIYTYRGRSLYKCFAEGCPCRGKVLDLVGFYCALRGCSNAQALRELARFFRADFPKTASPKSRKRVLEILTKNQEIVSLLPTVAPWAYKIPGTDLNTLDTLYRIAEEKAALLKPTRTGILPGESCQYIADHMERPPRMSQSLALLAYFGLIDRPPFDELTTAQFSNTLPIIPSVFAAPSLADLTKMLSFPRRKPGRSPKPISASCAKRHIPPWRNERKNGRSIAIRKSILPMMSSCRKKVRLQRLHAIRRHKVPKRHGAFLLATELRLTTVS